MSKYEDIKQIFEERVKKETFTMLCYEENSKSSMIISSKENFNYDDVCKDLKTSDTLFIFDDHIQYILIGNKLFGKFCRCRLYVGNEIFVFRQSASLVQ